MLGQDEVYALLRSCSNYLWSGPILWLLCSVGIYQTWCLKGLQLRYLPRALALSFSPTSAERQHAVQDQGHGAQLSDESYSSGQAKCNNHMMHSSGHDLNQNSKSTPSAPGAAAGDLSAFQALMTALAGSIGTGNITGIATAVTTGGLGALFWMWVMAFLGMATAYSEAILAIKYRRVNQHGKMSGGPMYTLMYGLNFRSLAWMYAAIAGIATICIGCLAQCHSMVDAVTGVFHIERIKVGIALAILTGVVIIGGVRVIGRVSGILVPLMTITYLAAAIGIVIWNYDQILPALMLIIDSAFNGQAAIGGFIGTTMVVAIQNGAQYGIFANEAGMGSLAIAASSAKAKPVEQGLRAIGGVFFSTIVVCTLTGLVLAVTQVVGTTDLHGNLLTGTPLAMAAFKSVHPSLEYIVVFSILLFAFTTMLAWAYYGEKCVEFLLGMKMAYSYRWVFTAVVIVGSVMHIKIVWAIASLATAMMALPNLISIMGLSKDVVAETKNYFGNLQDQVNGFVPSSKISKYLL